MRATSAARLLTTLLGQVELEYDRDLYDACVSALEAIGGTAAVPAIVEELTIHDDGRCDDRGTFRVLSEHETHWKLMTVLRAFPAEKSQAYPIIRWHVREMALHRMRPLESVESRMHGIVSFFYVAGVEALRDLLSDEEPEIIRLGAAYMILGRTRSRSRSPGSEDAELSALAFAVLGEIATTSSCEETRRAAEELIRSGELPTSFRGRWRPAGECPLD
jgi:hypothetical protein